MLLLHPLCTLLVGHPVHGCSFVAGRTVHCCNVWYLSRTFGYITRTTDYLAIFLEINSCFCSCNLCTTGGCNPHPVVYCREHSKAEHHLPAGASEPHVCRCRYGTARLCGCSMPRVRSTGWSVIVCCTITQTLGRATLSTGECVAQSVGWMHVYRRFDPCWGVFAFLSNPISILETLKTLATTLKDAGVHCCRRTP